MRYLATPSQPESRTKTPNRYSSDVASNAAVFPSAFFATASFTAIFTLSPGPAFFDANAQISTFARFAASVGVKRNSAAPSFAPSISTLPKISSPERNSKRFNNLTSETPTTKRSQLAPPSTVNVVTFVAISDPSDAIKIGSSARFGVATTLAALSFSTLSTPCAATFATSLATPVRSNAPFETPANPTTQSAAANLFPFFFIAVSPFFPFAAECNRLRRRRLRSRKKRFESVLRFRFSLFYPRSASKSRAVDKKRKPLPCRRLSIAKKQKRRPPRSAF